MKLNYAIAFTTITMAMASTIIVCKQTCNNTLFGNGIGLIIAFALLFVLGTISLIAAKTIDEN